MNKLKEDKEELIQESETTEDIPFFESMIKKPEFIMSWLGGLTELEQMVVSLLFQSNKAVTIKNIRSFMLYNTLFANKLIEDNIPVNRYTKNKVYLFPFQNFYYIPDEFKNRILDNYFSKDKIKGIGALLLLQKKIKFPSYERIDRTIQDLIRLKIVMERKKEDLENLKVKGLYFLNPVIRTHLQTIKENKFK
jgi:hypothetical protein